MLDPLAGSGTTLIACERLGREWIGIEISEEYCKITKTRLENPFVDKQNKKRSLIKKEMTKQTPVTVQGTIF